jgi:hypothetical protein
MSVLLVMPVVTVLIKGYAPLQMKFSLFYSYHPPRLDTLRLVLGFFSACDDYRRLSFLFTVCWCSTRFPPWLWLMFHSSISMTLLIGHGCFSSGGHHLQLNFSALCIYYHPPCP